MAKQAGIYKVIGTLDQSTFYRTAESGLLVRQKSNLDKVRVTTDPAFAGSRKASSEFGRASLAAGLIRTTMPIAGQELSDTRIYSRLTGVLQGITATDMIHEKGKRVLGDADLSRLLSFEWNKHRPFSQLYGGRPKFSIDAGSGLMEIDLPAIDGCLDFDPPKSATHAKLVLEGGGFDFKLGVGVGVTDSTEWLSLASKHPVHTLHGTVEVKPGMRLLLGIGVRFAQESNRVMYDLNERRYKGFVVGAVV